MASDDEAIEGWVVDIACLRKWSRAEVAERARRHAKACVLMGHCIESGFGLLEPDGTLSLLDAKATPLVVDAVRDSPKEKGIFLRAYRRREGEHFETMAIEEVAPPDFEPSAGRT